MFYIQVHLITHMCQYGAWRQYDLVDSSITPVLGTPSVRPSRDELRLQTFVDCKQLTVDKSVKTFAPFHLITVSIAKDNGYQLQNGILPYQNATLVETPVPLERFMVHALQGITKKRGKGNPQEIPEITFLTKTNKYWASLFTTNELFYLTDGHRILITEKAFYFRCFCGEEFRRNRELTTGARE